MSDRYRSYARLRWLEGAVDALVVVALLAAVWCGLGAI